MQSNPFAEPYRDPISALGIANAFANYSGCNNANLKKAADCLRAVDPWTLLNAEIAAEMDILTDITALLQIVVAWSPTVHTPYLPYTPLEAFRTGNVVDVPIIVGTTANETVIFVYEALNTSLSAIEYDVRHTHMHVHTHTQGGPARVFCPLH
jgi:carboxylesterase type B